MYSYQSILINLIDLDSKNMDATVSKTKNIISSDLSDDGTFWIICSAKKTNNKIIFYPFLIAEQFNEYYLKNIIIIPEFNAVGKGNAFKDHIYHVLFFAKKERYKFNKDPIREKHIWKDVEWGKRKKNYNPLGKDPGNVWLKTNDDGKANITEHVLVPLSEVVERIIRVSSDEKESCLLINCGQIKFKKYKRKIKHENF